MRDNLSDEEQEIYSRQIVLSDIGYEGQLRLRNARVCLLGLGGLGSPTAMKLAGMGVGFLRLVDRDTVSRSDLHRQYLYDTGQLGSPKVEAAFEKLGKLNPDVEMEPMSESVRSANIHALMEGMDVVIDGLDRPEPRYIVNRACVELGVPYVFGAAIEAFGNVSTLVPGQTQCLECFMGGLNNEDLPVCGVVGVHPSVLGVVSSVQVSEAVRLLTGREPKLLNRLLYIDLRNLEFNILDLRASNTCPTCGEQPAGPSPALKESFIEESCGRDGRRTYFLTPGERVEIDLVRLEDQLREKGLNIQASGRFGVTFELAEGFGICILKSGIMVAQVPPQPGKDRQEEIIEAYRILLVEGMGLPRTIMAGC